jgi:hypothetical protein
MKIQGALFDKMKATIRAVIDNKGGPAKVKELHKEHTRERMLWDLWAEAERNLMYDDNHPAFKSGTWHRVHPHEPGFNIYKVDETINDSHILTALKSIGKELGV